MRAFTVSMEGIHPLEASRALFAGQRRHARLRPGPASRRTLRGRGAVGGTGRECGGHRPDRRRSPRQVPGPRAAGGPRRPFPPCAGDGCFRPARPRCGRCGGRPRHRARHPARTGNDRRRPHAGAAAAEDVLGPEHPFLGSVGARPAEEAADVLADAAVGFWAAGVLPPLVRRELTAAFDRASDAGPFAAMVAADLGPSTAELQDFLAGLRDLDDAGRARWRLAVDEGRADHRPWAKAMHEAAWAAHVSGRTRALAAAQLHGVQAFLDGGFDLHDGAAGAWNAVAGCLQGIAMADLLDEASLAVLRAPWLRVTGAR